MRQVNFTDAELIDMLLWPEAKRPFGPPFAKRFFQVFGLKRLEVEDELVRWDVPAIPCAGIERVGTVDAATVAVRHQKVS